MRKKKVFISFDYDHDLELKGALVGQAKLDDSPFEIHDVSIKQAISSNWKYYARQKISESDVVIFICGQYTNTASGVAAEMSITHDLNKPYFLLCGRENGIVTKPLNAYRNDKIYDWTRRNLKLLIEGNR